MGKFTGFFTHLERETIRFFTVPNNTIAPALVSTFLYIVIFGVGLGNRISTPGMNYLEFLIPGLIMLNLINGAYSNPSGSLFMSRWLGHIQDVLSSPLSYMSLNWAYIIGGLSRGFTLGIGTWLVAMPFVFVPVRHPLIFISFMLLTAVVFACFGIIVGLWAKEWEQLNIFLNFLITPLIFLGGVFYSIEQVPPVIATITKFNPLFYMINGVRYGMVGQSDTPIWIGLTILLVLGTAMFTLCFCLFRKGWNLRT